MTFKLDVFRDFHLHGASAPEWDQRYLQLSQGLMQSALAEAATDGLHVFRKWMSERVVQQGCLPLGNICFAMLAGVGAGTPRMQGREIQPGSLFILRGGEEFMLQRPKGMELLAVTFRAEEFMRLLDARPWPAPSRALLARPVVEVAPQPVERLRRELLNGFTQSTAAGAQGGGAWLEPSGIFEALGNLFGAAVATRQAAGSASASYIVEECHRIVVQSAGAPPSIDALCRRLRTSRRSLQNSFRQVTDATATHYLRSVRLNAVRRRLLAAPAGELDVAQAAEEMGFSHLSHFAHRYRELFGELPSQTPRAARLARSR